MQKLVENQKGKMGSLVTAGREGENDDDGMVAGVGDDHCREGHGNVFGGNEMEQVQMFQLGRSVWCREGRMVVRLIHSC